MSEIIVSISAPTPEGRLIPKYDSSADILMASSAVPREWPFGVDIDGRIIFDLDALRMLANFDLHVGRRLWKRCSLPAWPKNVTEGNLIFTKETIRHKSFNLPLRISYDERQTFVEIVFNQKSPSDLVALSIDCIALLAHSSLVGFLVRNF